jgi:hypothetical protein
VLHRSVVMPRDAGAAPRRIQRIEEAAVLAASTFASVRPAIGILAAAVQQRLTTADRLADVVARSMRIRHRRVMLASLRDMAMGAEALSEIDFAALCRRHRLPTPARQAIRVEPSGRRRYLDAEWPCADGRRVVAEIDGAIHLTPARWFDDQLRQNEIVLAGATVLRYPSFVVRNEPRLVVAQLRRALQLRS